MWATVVFLILGAFFAGMIFSLVYRFVAVKSPNLAVLAAILARFGYNALMVL